MSKLLFIKYQNYFKFTLIFLSVACLLILSSKQAIAINVNIQLSKTTPLIGEPITITLTGDSNIASADLYYITQANGSNFNQVCYWPGGWTSIQNNVGVGQAVNFTPPALGKYYIVANIKDSAGNILCIGHFNWDLNQSCTNINYPKCQNAYASVEVINRPNVNIQLSKSSIELGEAINVKVTTDFAAHHADLYLITQSDGQDSNLVCKWPGGWSIIRQNIPLNQDISFVPPDAGNFYVVANLMDASNNAVCIGHFGWDANKSCTNVGKCNNAFVGLAVSSIDMNRYWNIRPGNYWIYQGMNYQLNQNSRERWDVEAKTRATNADYRSGYPLVMSKSNASGYWEPAYNDQEAATKKTNNSILKIWFNKETANCPVGGNCFTFPFWKVYDTPDYNQYYKLGKLWWVFQYGDTNLPGEFLSPSILNSLNLSYQTSSLNAYAKQDETNGFSEDSSYLYGSDLLPYHLKEGNTTAYTTVSSPAYNGQALLKKFSESGEYAGQWAVKEDYYLAKDIGPVKIAVKRFNVNYRNNYSLCSDSGRTCACSDVLAKDVPPGNDADCNSGSAIQKPMFDMVLAKYYLGGKLSVKLNGTNTSLTLKAGDSFSVDAIDSSTGYTYEGYLETNANFISADGQTMTNGKLNKWFDQSGKVNITISSGVSPGTYTTSFRPWISRLEPANSNAETIVEQANLPWSDQITINIVSPKPGDANGDGKVDILDFNLLITNFGNQTCGNQADFDKNCKVDIFDYNILLINFGK